MAHRIVELYAAGLEPEAVPLLERWIHCVAQAVEELGEDTAQEVILARAHEIEARLS